MGGSVYFVGLLVAITLALGAFASPLFLIPAAVLVLVALVGLPAAGARKARRQSGAEGGQPADTNHPAYNATFTPDQ